MQTKPFLPKTGGPRKMRRERSERILWGEEETRSDLKNSLREFLRLAKRAPTMVRPAGFEPATPGSEDRCSIQLSYERLFTYNT